MKSWKKQLDVFQKDVNAWKKIDSECTSKLIELKQDLVSFEKVLFLNKFEKFEDDVDTFGTGFDSNK